MNETNPLQTSVRQAVPLDTHISAGAPAPSQHKYAPSVVVAATRPPPFPHQRARRLTAPLVTLRVCLFYTGTRTPSPTPRATLNGSTVVYAARSAVGLGLRNSPP
ncbi:hypothetical protein DQ04_00041010 [Trypanosoma grayi]|uniref:hypothetical protein n=1 Tax=Trypanosoma grayi TaxID=71804 RepID=UPI0004F40A6A|nr:hypothetical protein DQ04_00041010 [Trypanosoma grayi]KEG15537.1 hypothetical protein DQ04_00041010 [Trypanosoma grayi]